jgi:membrane associated rhomboid family serine protease
LRQTVSSIRRTEEDWAQALEIAGAVVGLMVVMTFLEDVLPFDIRNLGIVPRTLPGLLGILFGPLLHLGFPHLLANALPLFVLLVLLFAHREYKPTWTFQCIWVGSGLGTWLIGRGGAVHIGASSLIYGLVVYLVAAGWWMRSWRAVAVALIVLIWYGGIFFGLLPQRGIVSWEGHLAGAVTGFFLARQQWAGPSRR